MNDSLGFRIIRSPYPASSKITGEIVQKVRDDGRCGPVVGDEALLWDALVSLERRHQETFDRLESSLIALNKAESEVEQLRTQLEQERHAKRGKRK